MARFLFGEGASGSAPRSVSSNVVVGDQDETYEVKLRIVELLLVAGSWNGVTLAVERARLLSTSWRLMARAVGAGQCWPG